MSLEHLFYIVNAAVVPFWAALVLAPRWSGTAFLLKTHLGPCALAVVYVCMAIAFIPGSEGSMGSLGSLTQAFSDEGVLLLGWVHYLSFDLLVGSWILRDAQRIGMRHLFVAPCLILTMMLGPSGWLAYVLAKRVKTRGDAETA